jgi:sodium/bile acid cotransporter 7
VQVVDRATILLLVYTSFCDSFAQGIWSGSSLASVGVTVALSLALLFAVMGAVHALTRLLGFPLEDRITAIFCASKRRWPRGCRWPR